MSQTREPSFEATALRLGAAGAVREHPVALPWHRQYDEDIARAGYRPRVVQRGTSPQNILALVATGVANRPCRR
jgi:hypothetical protein